MICAHLAYLSHLRSSLDFFRGHVVRVEPMKAIPHRPTAPLFGSGNGTGVAVCQLWAKRSLPVLMRLLNNRSCARHSNIFVAVEGFLWVREIFSNALGNNICVFNSHYCSLAQKR